MVLGEKLGTQCAESSEQSFKTVQQFNASFCVCLVRMTGLRVNASGSNLSQLISDIDCKIKGLIFNY